MCMFSGARAKRWVPWGSAEAVRVSGTRIFARVEGSRQGLAYSMQLAASSDVAMVLPLPVRPGCGDEGATFVDLSECPQLFDQLAMLFMPVEPYAKSASMLGFGPSRRALVVHSVGAFDASFVPTMADFERLDARFRLSDDVWSALPRYRDWGFAVFKLRKGASARVQPMALWFDTRDPSRTFFPTVHVHDGEVHATAEFDHELYWQSEVGAADDRSSLALSAHVAERTGGIALAAPARRRVMRGTYANDDVWVD